MNKLERLQALRKILERPESWCQGSFAQDENGKTVDSTNKRACKYCLAGGIRSLQLNDVEFLEIRNELSIHLMNTSLVDWNDDTSRKHTEVLELLDKAIESTKRGIINE